MFKPVLFLVLAAFGAFTAAVIWLEGLSGIFASITHSLGSMQIFIDLVIVLSLVMVWMWRDAKQKQRTIWPWLILTLVAGSFGLLMYLITDQKKHA
jgi:hypothetical protein